MRTRWYIIQMNIQHVKHIKIYIHKYHLAGEGQIFNYLFDSSIFIYLFDYSIFNYLFDYLIFNYLFNHQLFNGKSLSQLFHKPRPTLESPMFNRLQCDSPGTMMAMFRGTNHHHHHHHHHRFQHNRHSHHNLFSATCSTTWSSTSQRQPRGTTKRSVELSPTSTTSGDLGDLILTVIMVMTPIMKLVL